MLPEVKTIHEQIMDQYWMRIDRLIRSAAKAGQDLGISSPSVRERPGLPGQYEIVWEHQFLEPGAVPVSRPDQTWHVYRCSGGLPSDRPI